MIKIEPVGGKFVETREPTLLIGSRLGDVVPCVSFEERFGKPAPVREDVPFEGLESRPVDVKADIAVSDRQELSGLICLDSMSVNDRSSIEGRFELVSGGEWRRLKRKSR